MPVLVFSAHAADFCSRAGGTIAKLVRAGEQVKVVALTHGERSESGGLYADGARPALDEVREVRAKEARLAAGILGVELEFLDWEDLSFDYTKPNVKILNEEIRAFRPDIVLTHHGPDPRSVDHDVCYRLVSRAVQLASAPGLESEHAATRRPVLFLYEATVPLTELEGFSPDFFIDITDVWEIKARALEAFSRAQGFLLPWYTDVARRRGFQAARLSGSNEIEYAEAFERTSPWVGDHLPLWPLSSA